MIPYCDCGHLSRNHKDEGFGKCLVPKCGCQQFHNKDIQILEEVEETDPHLIKVSAELDLLALEHVTETPESFKKWFLDIVRFVNTYEFRRPWVKTAVADYLAAAIKGEPLSAITDSPTEWTLLQGGEGQGEGMKIWRNKRNPKLFSFDEGRTYFDMFDAVHGLIGNQKISNSSHAAEYDR